MEKIVSFCLQSAKPFFLLMPNFVYMKVSHPEITLENVFIIHCILWCGCVVYVQDYYTRLLVRHKASPFYVVPTKRLLYTTPKVTTYRHIDTSYLSWGFVITIHGRVGDRPKAASSHLPFPLSGECSNVTKPHRLRDSPLQVLPHDDPDAAKHRDTAAGKSQSGRQEDHRKWGRRGGCQASHLRPSCRATCRGTKVIECLIGRQQQNNNNKMVVRRPCCL
jgi:hypothetical protein